MAAALFSLPAMAQSSNQAGGQQPGKPPGQQGTSGSGQQDSKIQAMTQDKLRGSLEQAGFKNVIVLDAAYLVQAQSPHGEQVMMLINPPAIMSGSSGTGGATAGGSGGTGSPTAGDSGGAGGQPKAPSGKQ